MNILDYEIPIMIVIGMLIIVTISVIIKNCELK